MKKKYVRPEIKVIDLHLTTILAASDTNTLKWDGGSGNSVKVKEDTEVTDETLWKYL